MSKHLTVASKVHKNNAVKDVSLQGPRGRDRLHRGHRRQRPDRARLRPDRPGAASRPARSRSCGKDITHAPIRQRSIMGMSHIPEDRHKHGLVLDYTLEDNMVLQRYFEPEFTDKAGFLRRKNIRAYAEQPHRAVRRPLRSGSRHHGAQHVRRQPAEGHRRPRDRQEPGAARRRAADPRSGRRRHRVHPQAARRPARRGQGRAARVSGAGRGHGRVRTASSSCTRARSSASSTRRPPRRKSWASTWQARREMR